MTRCLVALLLLPLSLAAQDTRPQLQDSPPALSLPPLKDLPPPPSLLPPGGKKAEPGPAAPASIPPPPVPPPAKPAPVQDLSPPPSTIRPQQAVKTTQSSTSASGQFVVHGADLKVRSEITQRCEAVAAEMQRLLQDSTEGCIPIVVAIRAAPELNPNLPAVSPNISQLAHGGFHLQITVQARPDFNPNDLRTELIRLLLVERILREHKSITPKGRILPDWLLVGVHEALDFRSRTRPSALFAAVFGTGRVYGIEEILEVNITNLDALSRAIYNTSCCALVLTLLDQPDGPLAFGKFLSSLPTDTRNNRELLNHWFPGLALSASSLDKWWSLQMASLSRPSVFETLGPAETAQALEQVLYFRVEGASSEGSSRSTRTASATVKKTEPAAEAAPEAEPEKKVGIIRGLFRRDDKKDAEATTETKAEAKPESKPTAATKPEPAEPVKEEGSGGLLGRLFGIGGKDKGDEQGKDEPKETGNKDSKKEDAEPEKTNGKKKDTSWLSPQTGLHLYSPLLAMAYETLMPAQAMSGRPVVTLFGLGKKKTPEEIAAEEKAKAEKAAARQNEEEAEKAADAAKDAAKKKAAEDKAKAREEEKAKEAAAKAERDAARAKSKEEKDNPPAKEDEKKEPEAKTAEKTASQATPPPAPAPKPRPKPTSTSIPVEEFAKVASRKDAKAICTATINNLAALNKRAHPLFRPIITQYIAVIGSIAEGKTKEAAAALAELRVAREAALAKAKEVQAHLDWFEASETKNYTGTFDDYLRLPETISKEIPPRTDVISRHLDEVEKGGK